MTERRPEPPQRAAEPVGAGSHEPPPAASTVQPATGEHPGPTVRLDRLDVWRAAWVVVAVVALAALGRWILADGGPVIFTLIMSMLASVAMEPAVARLAQRMRRGAATAVVMLGVLLFLSLFLLAFGRLLAEQLATLARSIPVLIQSATAWANDTFDASIGSEDLLGQLGGSTTALAGLAGDLAGGLIGLVATVLGAAFSSITFVFFTFYLSADGPRLRRWVARLAPPRQQEFIQVAWQIAVIKTGGYLSARLVLAAICGASAAVFMLVIGMPYWLALGIWTGLVAQFVPTVGTYIAIAFPVVVGLIGDQPWQGLAVLGFALVYQQIENVTIEPRISAQAVDVHPAVSFAAVMFGAALFGVAGAFVAVPVAAMLLTLFDIYAHTYEVLEQAPAPGEDVAAG